MGRLGFVAGVREKLAGLRQRVATVTSVAEQFRSSTAAAADLRAVYARARTLGVSVTPFPVAGIPGALGHEISGPGGLTRWVGFVDGPFCYVVSEVVPAGAPGAPNRADLDRAATKLYRRVHGRTAV